MRKHLYIFLLTLLLPIASGAQFRTSIEGTGQWYVDDSKIPLPSEDSSRLFANAYLNFGYTINDWDFGLQLESYAPRPLLNYSPNLHDVHIGTLHVRYNNTRLGLDVTGGHFYEQFGSGFVFRTWEDRQLGINNALFGGRIIYTPFAGAKLTVLGGKQRTGMGFDFSNGVVSGADLSVSISELFNLSGYDFGGGFSYVGRYEDVQDDYPTLPALTSAFSGRVNFGRGGFYLNGEWVYKDYDMLVESGKILPKAQHAGHALLLNFGYTQRGFGIDLNLRRTENMGFFSQRDLSGNQYNTGVLNYLPALTRQYDHSLQNIYIYQAQSYWQYKEVDKAGEIGGQLDVFYDFAKGTLLGGQYGTNIAFNASYWGGLAADFQTDPKDFTKRSTSVELFKVGNKTYHDVGLEVRKRVSKDLSLIVSYLNQYYNKQYVEEKYGQINAHTVACEATYKFGVAQSVKFEAQHQWADAGYKHWAGGLLEYTLNYHWSLYVNDLYNYGNDEESERIHYYNAGFTFTQGATRVSAGYGRQRGGQLCVGGVCRVVSPFSGLTLNIATAF